MRESERLEQLWGGQFGDDYTLRNAGTWEARRPFWRNIIKKLHLGRVLEVGSGGCANLRWINGKTEAYGVDINDVALRTARCAYPNLNLVKSTAKDLPFKDKYFDLVFTCGVLIHQPDDSLYRVMQEIMRCSKRYVMCMEYHADGKVEVPYRGQTGALFKRNYGSLYLSGFRCRLVEGRFLGKVDGFDNVEVRLIEKL